MDLAQLDSGVQVSGILEVMPDGYGFIRSAIIFRGRTMCMCLLPRYVGSA